VIQTLQFRANQIKNVFIVKPVKIRSNWNA